MNEIEFSSDLAAGLDRIVPLDETLRGDWNDIVARVGRRPRRPRGLRPPRGRAVRLAFVVVALLLLLAGVATATYRALRSSQPPPAVVALDANGRLRPVWRCPSGADCGALVMDAAVAPNGRYLALVLDSANSLSLYQDGIHVIDLARDADRHLPTAPPDPATPAAQIRAWGDYHRAAAQFLGCVPTAEPDVLAPPAVEFAWSPDGSRLAYACAVLTRGSVVGRIYTIRPDGTGRQLLRTGTRSAYWPSWSPDGKRIAFSTEPAPFVPGRGRNTGQPRRWALSAIYVVDLDGSHSQRVARAGAAPTWSPDGSLIAYSAPACTGLRIASAQTRLVTPTGRDVTPRSHAPCGGIGPKGSPVAAWSPDGRRLAVRTWNGLYVMRPDGSQVRRVPGTDGFGRSRPVWEPNREGR